MALIILAPYSAAPRNVQDGQHVYFLSAGRQIEQIQIPDEEWTANVSFCGQDKRTLFITASKGLYGIRMRVSGANAAK
jgi:gluconolactonase